MLRLWEWHGRKEKETISLVFSDTVSMFHFGFSLCFTVWETFAFQNHACFVLLTGELLTLLCTGGVAISVGFS